MKTQTIRLIDVFVLGPFMVWYAVRSTRMPTVARAALAATGVATSLYNGRNYLLEQQR